MFCYFSDSDQSGIPDAPQYCDKLNVSTHTAQLACLPGYRGGEDLDFQAYKLAVNIDKVTIFTMKFILCHSVKVQSDFEHNYARSSCLIAHLIAVNFILFNSLFQYTGDRTTSISFCLSISLFCQHCPCILIHSSFF